MYRLAYLCTWPPTIPKKYLSVLENVSGERVPYQTTCGLLMCTLSSHFESNIVGGVALNFESCRADVIKVFGEQL
jgi:hypothetical protein